MRHASVVTTIALLVLTGGGCGDPPSHPLLQPADVVGRYESELLDEGGARISMAPDWGFVLVWELVDPKNRTHLVRLEGTWRIDGEYVVLHTVRRDGEAVTIPDSRVRYQNNRLENFGGHGKITLTRVDVAENELERWLAGGGG